MRASKDARVDARATLEDATRRSKKMRETSVRDGVARLPRSTARVVVCGRMMGGWPMAGRSRGRARAAAPGRRRRMDDGDID